jgi:probable HAF family extracellular repeat protein
MGFPHAALNSNYQVVDLTAGLPYPDAYGLNYHDQICGDTTADGSSFYSFIERTPGNPTPGDPNDAQSASLYALNDAGVAVGAFLDAKGARRAYSCDQNNQTTDLSPIIGQPESWAADINNGGVIVGGVRHSSDWNDPFTRAFIYEPGAANPVRILEGFPNYPNCYASAINSEGQVVGTCFDNEQMNYKPFLFSGGKVTDFSGQPGFAMDINDNGDIACTTEDFWTNQSSSGPFLWANNKVNWLPTTGVPSAINNADLVVGSSMLPNGSQYGYLYQNGVVYDLNTLVWVDYQLSPLRIVNAWDINERGHIIAGAFDSGWQAYVLLLIPPSTTIISRPQYVVALVARVTSGVKSDGGGMAFIAGRPIPVDPWGRMSERQIEVTFARATARIARRFAGDPEAELQALDSVRALRQRLALLKNKARGRQR